MQEIFRLKLPLYITTGKRKKKRNFLNLNVEFRSHFQLRKTIKEIYVNTVSELLKDMPKYDKILIAYTVYYADRRLVDIGNICSMQDKFLCDTLTANGKIPDDNYNYVPSVLFQWGGVDKEHPRVEAEVYDANVYEFKVVRKGD